MSAVLFLLQSDGGLWKAVLQIYYWSLIIITNDDDQSDWRLPTVDTVDNGQWLWAEIWG